MHEVSRAVQSFAAERCHEVSRDAQSSQRSAVRHEVSHRRGPLLDFANRTVNASLFLAEVRCCFEEYCEQLERSAWGSEV